MQRGNEVEHKLCEINVCCLVVVLAVDARSLVRDCLRVEDCGVERLCALHNELVVGYGGVVSEVGKELRALIRAGSVQRRKEIDARTGRERAKEEIRSARIETRRVQATACQPEFCVHQSCDQEITKRKVARSTPRRAAARARRTGPTSPPAEMAVTGSSRRLTVISYGIFPVSNFLSTNSAVPHGAINPLLSGLHSIGGCVSRKETFWFSGRKQNSFTATCAPGQS